jgi:hypothetical protein
VGGIRLIAVDSQNDPLRKMIMSEQDRNLPSAKPYLICEATPAVVEQKNLFLSRYFR